MAFPFRLEDMGGSADLSFVKTESAEAVSAARPSSTGGPRLNTEIGADSESWFAPVDRPRNAGQERRMDRARFDPRRRALAWLLPCVLLATTGVGCQTVTTPEDKIARSNMPGELRKISMPEYVIEPPDLLLIEVLEALPGRPITGERLVRPDGTITLGFYGDVYVTGLTLKEAKEKIILHLKSFLSEDTLGLTYYDDDPNSAGNPDAAPKVKRVNPADSDRVFVDVSAYNSKYYYVTGDVGLPGRLPITGNETVLDAILYSGGLMDTAAVQNIRLVRPAPPGACCEQVLPVNYSEIVYKGDTTTNYQLMPGDRLVVYRDPIVRTTIMLGRLAAPFGTVVNTILTYSFTARSVKSIDVPINGTQSSNTNRGTPGLGANPFPAR
jgi:polysaccharide biosynthesis/export protein